MFFKTCTQCGINKSEDEFFRANWLSDGRRPDCKECHKRHRTNRKLEYTIHDMAKGILDRCVRRTDYKNKSYEGIECRIGKTSNEVYQYLTEYFYNDVKSLLDKGLTPSIDRIDSSKHYEEGNLRIIPLSENIKLGGKTTQERLGQKILVTYPSGFIKVFPSIKNCADELGIKRDTIYRNLDTNRTGRTGYKFNSIN